MVAPGLLAAGIAQAWEDLNRFVEESARLVTALVLHGDAPVCKQSQRETALCSLRVVGIDYCSASSGLSRRLLRRLLRRQKQLARTARRLLRLGSSRDRKEKAEERLNKEKEGTEEKGELMIVVS